MAKKDYTVSENIEHDKNPPADEDRKSHRTTGDNHPGDTKGVGEPEIKNAHASGDGSFGRNDESLPDEEKSGPPNNNY